MTPHDEMEKVFKYLELDINQIEIESQLNLPVSGSSELKGNKDGIHWQPVKKIHPLIQLKDIIVGQK
jgi:hypothetical protein